MTQSGQGGEHELPAARPAHEAVVLPADDGAPWTPGAPAAGQGGQAGQGVPADGQPWGQHWGPQSAGPPQPDQQAQGHYGYPPAQPLPPAQQPPGPEAYQQPGAYQQPQQPGSYQQPPQQQQSQQPGGYQPQHQQPQPPHQPQQPYAQPLPPEVGPGGQGGQTGQAGQGVPGGDADATQFIAPVPGGPGPVGPAPGGGDADATQYIPPVPGGAPYGGRPGVPGDRQPPAEFDNLFRTDEPAGATQQMPQVDAGQQPQPPYQPPYQQQSPPPYQQQPPSPYQQQGYQPQQQGYQPQQHSQGGQLPPHAPGGYRSGLQGLQGRAEQDGPPAHLDGEPPRRRSAHVPLIAGVVVGCAVIGLGAGALMSGGDDSGKDDKQPVAAQSSPVAEPTAKAAPDPAKPQAKALDRLLADSNNSRAAVISAVEKIKSCTDLDQANTDLKDAAQQRRDLVTRLGELTVDKLPRSAELTSSLNRAWKASAAADEHYATWARQAKKNKSVCKGGKARSTNETARGNQQSGVATEAKREASKLWNAIAAKYGLAKHAYTEL
ncbi:hypothetical protein [Streptomyces sp. NPDC048142]|uniref:hypothetical protein n=1 Tax=Streptomyces sp. NPDC048142 TaxID=3365501 RepID=UPI00371F878B